MRLGGSFTVTASYFFLWFLHVNIRVHTVHHNIPKLCHFLMMTIVSCAINAVNIKFWFNVQCEVLPRRSVISE